MNLATKGLATSNGKWQYAPTGLIFSRQNIKNLPNSSYANTDRVKRGAYLVQQVPEPRATLIASGSEVATLVAGAEAFECRGDRGKYSIGTE